MCWVSKYRYFDMDRALRLWWPAHLRNECGFDTLGLMRENKKKKYEKSWALNILDVSFELLQTCPCP